MDHVPSCDGTTSYRPQSSRVNATPLCPDLVKERLFEDWRILRHRRITPGGID
jgi:hypothetical protein